MATRAVPSLPFEAGANPRVRFHCPNCLEEVFYSGKTAQRFEFRTAGTSTYGSYGAARLENSQTGGRAPARECHQLHQRELILAPAAPMYATSRSIQHRNVHPGVDIVYYGVGGRLEYDFVVLAPGTKPASIEVAFDGADKISTDSGGDLLIEAGSAVIRQHRPHVYQLVDGSKRIVTAEYRVLASDRVQFALGQFDRSRQLVIDPVIQYSTYLGKSGQDSAVSVAVDNSGNAYVAGETNSIDLAVGNPFQSTRAGDTDAFVGKNQRLRSRSSSSRIWAGRKPTQGSGSLWIPPAMCC